MRLNQKILNVTCTQADTPYTLELPTEAVTVVLQCRTDAHKIRVAFQDGDAAATRPFFTIKGNEPAVKIPCFAGGIRSRVLQVQSSDAGAVLEAIVYG